MPSQATLTTQRGRQSRPPASRDLDDVQSPHQTRSRPQKRFRETIHVSSPPSDTPEEETPPPPSKRQLQAIERARLQDERVQHEEFAIIATTYLGSNRAYSVSKSVKLGEFNFIEFYSTALIKVRGFARSLNVEYDGPFQCTAMATFNNNKEDDATSDVNEMDEWKSFESIIRNWMRQGKAGIRVKLIQKYRIPGEDPQPTAPVSSASPIAATTSRSSASRVDKPARRVRILCLSDNADVFK